MKIEQGYTKAQMTWLMMLRLFIGDRKSTRLNSSHDQIAYAVFCLKKRLVGVLVGVGGGGGG